MDTKNECKAPTAIEQLIRATHIVADENEALAKRKEEDLKLFGSISKERDAYARQVNELKQKLEAADRKASIASAPILTDTELHVLAMLATQPTIIRAERMTYRQPDFRGFGEPNLEFSGVVDGVGVDIQREARARLVTELKRRGVLKP